MVLLMFINYKNLNIKWNYPSILFGLKSNDLYIILHVTSFSKNKKDKKLIFAMIIKDRKINFYFPNIRQIPNIGIVDK